MSICPCAEVKSLVRYTQLLGQMYEEHFLGFCDRAS
jgi:hypothetical protein